MDLERWERTASLALLCGVVAIPSAARASTSCSATPQGTFCTSQVDFATFAQEAYQSQYQDEWCWAASISMVFAYYGHPVAQPRIVSDVYGSPVDMPAQYGMVIARELNRVWRDDLGSVFTSQLTGAYDSQAGINSVSNQQIVSELDQGHPLVIGARTHAMVVTAVQYYVTPGQPNIVQVGVFDPWPGIGARSLASDEMVADALGGSMHFLATVRVTEGGTLPDPRPRGCAVVAPGDLSWCPLLFTLLLFRRRSRPCADKTAV